MGRPWIQPAEVREYSDIDAVKNRSDAKLTVDITRAEAAVIKYTHNTFDGQETLPAEVKSALLILTEYYAYQAAKALGGVKSETFDDYSYTVSDSMLAISDLGIASLLDEYIQKQGTVTMKLRKL